MKETIHNDVAEDEKLEEATEEKPKSTVLEIHKGGVFTNSKFKAEAEPKKVKFHMEKRIPLNRKQRRCIMKMNRGK